MADEQNRVDAEEHFSEMAKQFFDLGINPVGQMFCTFLVLQVSKKIITKDEARGVIASSVDLINQLPYPPEVLENGYDMLQRMIAAINRIPNG